jgi:glycosyltransferase involved in cell wall biosynthesis
MSLLLHKITIIQRIVPHYRVPFFEALHHELVRSGIEVRLIYGQEFPGTVPCSVMMEYPWAVRIDNRYLNSPFGQLVWQPCLGELQDSELIVLEQANSLLLNYWLMANQKSGKFKLAFWGHGRNFQVGHRHSWRERMKKWFSTRVDWWFAYTELSAELVRKAGFPRDRITIVQNTIDTNELRSAITEVTQADLRALRAYLNLPSTHVGLYCGGMYSDKQLDFLITACQLIRQRIRDFQMILIGSGPDQWKAERAAGKHDWIHYVGPKFKQERALYFKVSQVLLMPGLVGLAIVDSFIAETPLFTTDIPVHSPEISYLQHGVNGVMTSFAVNSYADAVVEFFESDDLQNQLRDGCRRSASIYTFEHFVDQFAAGIVRCLASREDAR